MQPGAPAGGPRRAAFLDRDGVINIDHGYVCRREDFEFVPGVLDAARHLHEAGLALVVVTNQAGIARGRYTEADYQQLTAWLVQRFAEAHAPLAGVYHCPHHPAGSVAEYRQDCACRKPAPGMLLAAARDLNLDLSASIFFGDKDSDLEAAAAAGVPQRILLNTDGLDTAANGGIGDRYGSTGALATGRARSLAVAVAGMDLPRAGP